MLISSLGNRSVNCPASGGKTKQKMRASGDDCGLPGFNTPKIQTYRDTDTEAGTLLPPRRGHPRPPIHSALSLTCPGTRPSGARGRRLQSRGRGPGSEHRRGERATRAGRERAAQAGGVPEQQGRAEPPRALIHAGRRRLLRRADEPGRAERVGRARARPGSL